MAEPGSPTGVAAPSAVGGPVDVIVDDQQAELAVDADRWAVLAAAVLRSEGARGELTLTFVDRDEMTALNHEHMGHDRPTDVLSFPLDSLGSPDHDPIPGAPVLLGDVVVCPAVAAAAAPAHAGTVEDEIALLVVHGCLHVMGYDHAEPEETRIMRARELELLVAHHWGGPAPDGFRQEQEQ
jgi:probable rRNA maturation factor